MLPLIREGIDTVKIVKVERKIKRGDVVLYKRDDDYVLHRVVKVKSSKTVPEFTMCGDNQIVLEKGVTLDRVIGVMDGFYKEEKYISINDLEYIKYYKKRLRNRIFRKIKCLIKRAFRIFKKS